MGYLLDTNIISDLVRHPQGRVAAQIRKIGEARVCTSVIVSAELRFGAAKRGSPRLAAQLEAVLAALDVLPFEVPADAAYGLIRARLEKAGQPIGGNDLLTAAHALVLGHTMVTDNEAEFARIKGLPRENWLRPPERRARPRTMAVVAYSIGSKSSTGTLYIGAKPLI